MQADGVIGKYAIGGAVGATFYLEPAATLDVDIFVALPSTGGGLLVNLAPIYGYLKAHGGKVDGEYVVIGGGPGEVFPPSDAPDQEALAEAVLTKVEGVGDCGMTAGHPVAVALCTGRT